ncbi:hypothetical protein GCM10010434_086770 [Winogradskya humida]
MAEDDGHVAEDQVQEGLLALGDALAGEGPGEGRAGDGAGGCGPAGRAAYQAAQNVGNRRRARLAVQCGQIERGGDQDGASGRGGLVEHPQTFGRTQGNQPTAAHAFQVGVPEVPRHAAGLGPQPPRQRGGGQAPGPAVLRQRVQVGVRRRVVALAGATEHAGDGGEHHERRQVPGEFVQVPSSVRLRPEDGVDPLRRQRSDRRVVQDTRRVDHRGDLMPGQQYGQRIPVSDIARREHNLSAQRDQFSTQLLRTLGSRTTPAHQHQTPDTTLRDQMPGDQATEHARRTGDQNGTRTEPWILHHRTLDAGQTRRADHTRPHRQLRLIGSQGPGQHVP